MKATDLFLYKKEELETEKGFAKRMRETAKRVNKSLILDPLETFTVIQRLANYYKEDTLYIKSVIHNITDSRRREFRFDYVQSLGDWYLMFDI